MALFRKINWLGVGMLMGGVHLAVAAPVSSRVTLQQAYVAALGYDAKIAAARSALESDQEQVGYARSFLLPNVVAAANGGYGKSEIDYAVNTLMMQDKTTPYFEKYGYTLRLTQPVYRKNYIDGYRQAGYLQQQGELRFQLAVQDLALRVAQAYFDVLLAQSNVELADAESQATAKRLDTVKIAHSVGTITLTEVYDAQARFDLSRARAISAQSQLDVARQALARIIGNTPQSLARWPDSFPLLAPEPANVETWKASAIKDNFQVLTALAGVDVARLELERQLGLVYPALDVVASYANNYAGDGTFGGKNTGINSGVTLELSMPLFSGGSVTIKSRQLHADIHKAEHLHTDAKREAELQTQQAFNAVIFGVEQIKALQQGEKSSQSSLDAMQKGFEHGLRTMIDVLNAQQQLFSAKRDLVSAKYQYMLNRFKLKAAVGQLTQADIDAASALLDAK